MTQYKIYYNRARQYLEVCCSRALSAAAWAWPSAQLLLGGGEGSLLEGALPFLRAGLGEAGSKLPLLEGGAAAGVGDIRAAAQHQNAGCTQKLCKGLS